MGKQKRIRAQRQSVAGMHELKSKKMPRVTINKRRGRVLTNKKKRRVLKSVAAAVYARRGQPLPVDRPPDPWAETGYTVTEEQLRKRI